MQKRHWLAAALALALAPVGCAALQGPQAERAQRSEPRDDELAERQAQRDEARERVRDGRQPRTPQEARRGPATEYISDVRCPAAMDGVDVVAIDAGAGGALEFRVRDRGDAQQVRDRVLGLMREAEGDADAGRFEPLEADSVRYHRTDEGARLIFVTRGDDAITNLRSQLQQRADMMRSEERCERGIVSMR